MFSLRLRPAALLSAIAWLALIGCMLGDESAASRWVEFRPQHPPYRTAEQTEVVVLRLRARSSPATLEKRLLERADQLERMLHGLSGEDLVDTDRRQSLERQIREVFSGLAHEISATDLYVQPLPAEPDEEVLDALLRSDADA